MRLRGKLFAGYHFKFTTLGRQIWYPPAEVKGQSFVLAKLPAQEYLMREWRGAVQEVLKTSS